MLLFLLLESAKIRGYFYFHKPKKYGGAVIKTWVAGIDLLVY